MELLFAGIIIATAGLSWPWLRRRRRVYRWRKRLQLNLHQADFNLLYSDVDGFALSKQARAQQDSMEYVYGEIEFESFIALLSICPITPQTVFYDLGSGVGKAVIACAMVFNLQAYRGIELFEELHQVAKRRAALLQKIPRYQDKALHIAFKQGDIWQEPFSDATLIFVNATAFFGERWTQLSHHIGQVKPGSLVISTSKALDSDLFEPISEKPLRMSWGVVKAYIQRRR